MVLTMAGAGALSGAGTVPGQARPVERSVDVAHAPAHAADAESPVRSLSFLVPARNEEGNIGELYRRLGDVLARVNLPYEIIFIDDGSTDNTWGIVRELRTGDERVRGIRHRRNFGKAQALANGFAVAGGDVIVTMDDPDELPNFLAKLNEGYDLVSGWKQRRKDPLGKTFPSKIFNRTVRAASGVPLHDFNCGYKAYRRDVTQSIRLYGELHRFTPVLAHAQGFRIGEIPVKHHARKWGQSKYGWSRLVKGFLDLLTVVFLTQYRQRPMHLFGLPGLLALGLGVLIGLGLSADKIFSGSQIGTRPLLLLAVLLVVLGAQFFGLGLLGEYLAHSSAAPQVGQGLQPLVRDTIGFAPVAHADPAAVVSMPEPPMHGTGPA
jgi:glycosyltransferase involved in cell wall biosynthesis